MVHKLIIQQGEGLKLNCVHIFTDKNDKKCIVKMYTFQNNSVRQRPYMYTQVMIFIIIFSGLLNCIAGLFEITLMILKFSPKFTMKI